MLDIITKRYQELTITELYDLLQLRCEVFIVEQNCIYQDLDGKDDKAVHIIGKKNNKIIAYSRVFKPGDYFNYAGIGRVVVSKEERYRKYGYDIIKASIIAIKEYYNQTIIKLSAQLYLKSFYNNLGFKEIGEAYLEDNIPHITMIRN